MRIFRGIVRPLLLTLLCVLPVACGPARGVDAEDPLTRSVQKGLNQGQKTFSHDAFDALLQKHVRPSGRVDYAGLVKDKKELQAYLDQLAGADPASLSRPELLAFFINAYNAYTLKVIVDSYPVKSIRDLSSPWDTAFCKVGGSTVTLNHIEHMILRPKELFDDPRMHFAINCASIGCPLLRQGAYTGAGIDKQLDEAVRRAMKDERYLRVSSGGVEVTKILSWFKGDFTEKYGSLAKFLAPHIEEGEAKKILQDKGDSAIDFLGYDWNLNDTATASS
jgi:hypothetical protein